MKSLCYVTLSGTVAFGIASIYKGNDKFYSNFVMPVMHKFDPETVHNLGIKINKYNLLAKSKYKDPEILVLNNYYN